MKCSPWIKNILIYLVSIVLHMELGIRIGTEYLTVFGSHPGTHSVYRISEHQKSHLYLICKYGKWSEKGTIRSYSQLPPSAAFWKDTVRSYTASTECIILEHGFHEARFLKKKIKNSGNNPKCRQWLFISVRKK